MKDLLLSFYLSEKLRVQLSPENTVKTDFSREDRQVAPLLYGAAILVTVMYKVTSAQNRGESSLPQALEVTRSPGHLYPTRFLQSFLIVLSSY